MQFLAVSLPTVYENLALDEALLLEAEAGRMGETLRVWEHARPAVVLGAGSVLIDDVHHARCLADNVPIARRTSGGGTVLIGQGCLLLTLILSYQRSALLRRIASSYRYVLGRLADSLRDVAANVGHAGISDLAVAGRKMSGNSQQRKKDFLLHHGSLLYEFDVGLMDRYLRLPKRQPEYRQQRRHNDFVVNLSRNVDELVQRLCVAWQANEATYEWPEDKVRRLLSEKHARQEWIRRR